MRISGIEPSSVIIKPKKEVEKCEKVKSFLPSFLSVASSWISSYTSCDDFTWWRQAAFAYAVNRSNALTTENILFKWGLGKE